MISTRTYAALLLAALAGAAAVLVYGAQPQTQMPQPSAPLAARSATPMNLSLVVLDPAHGGPDNGATLGDKLFEKDIDAALATRLRTSLMAAGFNVIATREADAADAITGDQRAEIANRANPVACIVLHVTATGTGVHLFTSTLRPSEADPFDAGPPAPIPWDTAQAAYVDRSLHLVADLHSALAQSALPILEGQAPLKPLDNMMCPAVAIEMAPLLAPDGARTPVTDTAYQQRVADSVTAALKSWRSHADPVAAASAQAAATAQAAAQARAIAAAEAAGMAAAKSRDRAAAAVSAAKGQP